WSTAAAPGRRSRGQPDIPPAIVAFEWRIALPSACSFRASLRDIEFTEDTYMRSGHNSEPRQSFPWRGYRRNLEVLPTISYGGALCYCRSPCLSPWSSWWTVSPCPHRPRGDGGVLQCIPIASV